MPAERHSNCSEHSDHSQKTNAPSFQHGPMQARTPNPPIIICTRHSVLRSQSMTQTSVHSQTLEREYVYEHQPDI